jgi:hypothetical protein
MLLLKSRDCCTFNLIILMKQLLSILLLSALLLDSCSKSSTPTSTNNNNNNNGGNGGASTNQVVATVNGTAVTFKTLGTSGNGTYAGGYIAFAAGARDSATGQTIAFGGGGFVSTGTYDIGTKNLSPVYGFGLTYSAKDNYGNTMNYGTNSSTYAKVGSITISSISATNAQGTFNATLPLISGPSGSPSTVTITNGGFNLVF